MGFHLNSIHQLTSHEPFMPMLSSPQVATRAGHVHAQNPWENSFTSSARPSSDGTTPPAGSSDDDILLPLNKSRTSSLGCLTNAAFRPFEPGMRPAATLHISNLPNDISQRELHLMFTFATDYMSCEIHRPSTGEDSLMRSASSVSATARFRTLAGASAASAVLEHKPDMFGSLWGGSMPQGNMLKCDVRPLNGVSTPTGSAKSRFLFMNDDPSTPNTDTGSAGFSIPSSPLYGGRLFDGALPLPRRPSQAANAVYSEDKIRPGPPTRRASVPNRPIHDMSPVYSSNAQSSVGSSGNGSSHSSHANGGESSKVSMPFGPSTSKAKAMSIMQNGGRVMPPANPADQNPPCNTLYVGNLPPDTSEDELKELFSSRPGYKRLCFRTKANGPMCFVEFDDEVYAGRALEDLYGFGLSNSVKGGIRLSFSKNPLGVRSRQPQQQKYYS